MTVSPGVFNGNPTLKPVIYPVSTCIHLLLYIPVIVCCGPPCWARCRLGPLSVTVTPVLVSSVTTQSPVSPYVPVYSSLPSRHTTHPPHIPADIL